jgi:hypothetical protein
MAVARSCRRGCDFADYLFAIGQKKLNGRGVTLSFHDPPTLKYAPLIPANARIQSSAKELDARIPPSLKASADLTHSPPKPLA